MFYGSNPARQPNSSFASYNNTATILATSTTPVSTVMPQPYPSVAYQSFNSTTATNTVTVSDPSNLNASHTLTVKIPARNILVNPNNICPIFTSSASVNGVSVTQDSYKTTSQEGWCAFSGTSYWTSNVSANGWLQIQFPTQMFVQMYIMNTGNDVNAPKSWNFQGSNDGTNYVTLDAVSNIANAAVQQRILPNPAFYSYYRMYVTAINGGNNIIIYSLGLYNTGVSVTLLMNGGIPNGTTMTLSSP